MAGDHGETIRGLQLKKFEDGFVEFDTGCTNFFDIQHVFNEML